MALEEMGRRWKTWADALDDGGGTAAKKKEDVESRRREGQMC